MAFNYDAGRNGSIAQMQPPQGPFSPPGRQDLSPQLASAKRPPRRRFIAIASFALLVLLIFAALRFSMVATSNDLLQIHIGSQQAATLDLRQSTPISSAFMGTNVFPLANTNSFDAVSQGFMHFTPLVQGDLSNVNIGFMRYPGGDWGEQHILSLSQLRDFTNMLIATHSQGMIQTHISGPINGQPQGMTSIDAGANLAASWVNYMNDKKSFMRIGAYAHDPFHPVQLWTVGNEPDRLTEPYVSPKSVYTVNDYVQTFIQYSKLMHQNDPTIKVFGPELSQFYGIGAGPFDPNGKAWMEGFLQGVGAYQKAHPDLPYHLLDGVSFHRYQFTNASNQPGLLLSSANEWNYILPSLRLEIKRDLGYDAPIAVTEINTNPTNQVPTRGQAALWFADTLGTLMNQQVGYVGFFSTTDVPTPYPLFAGQGQQETPMYRVMQLFSHLQGNLVPLSIEHEPVSVYATQDSTHQTVSLMFVNKSELVQNAQVDPVEQFLTVSPWHHLDITLAADSIVVVTLHRNGSGDAYANAYSYQVPASTDPSTQQLLYTVCGHKQDALANGIPC